jgi:hypothetical protein
MSYEQRNLVLSAKVGKPENQTVLSAASVVLLLPLPLLRLCFGYKFNVVALSILQAI